MLCGPVERTRVGREHTRVPALSARVVSGPCSTISAQNSWPMTTSRLRSMTRGLPERLEISTKRSACLRACRSEPQIPAGQRTHEHLAWTGLGRRNVADHQGPVAHDHGAQGRLLSE